MNLPDIELDGAVDALEYLPRTRTFSYVQGDVIYGYGQPSTHLYVVVRGSVKVGWFKPSNRWLNLEIYGPDEIFGESVLTQQPCPAWAIAGHGTELMLWTRLEMEILTAERPRLGLALTQIVTRRLIKRGEQFRALKLRPDQADRHD